MDPTPVTLITLAEVLKYYGPFGLLLVIWWLDSRRFDKVLVEHRRYMDELRGMYTSNVSLVKSWESVATDLKSLVVLNTQCMTQLSDDVRQNQFCPQLRIEKKTVQQARGAE